MTGYCQLGAMRWRVDPSNVSWSYALDTAVIDTLGGQVIQVVGASLSDLTVSGDFGHQWNAAGQSGGGKQSWLLANNFHYQIKQMMDNQMSIPHMRGAQGAAKGGHKIKAEDTSVAQPWTFTYSDGVHNWSFKVLVKGLADGAGESSLTHTNGRYNYTYALTLFIVQADSDLVQTVSSDAFISRIAKGVGWKKSNYHGTVTVADVHALVMANGGQISEMIAKALGGELLNRPTPGTVASTTPTGTKATVEVTPSGTAPPTSTPTKPGGGSPPKPKPKPKGDS
jgi:hypothetical protein